MRAVVQRVTEARVGIGGEVVAAIAKGMLVLLGVGKDDTERDADYLAEKVSGLRIFPDDTGRMNLDVRQAGGSVLVVSQFTLYGAVRRGRRPGFDGAAPPEQARVLYEYFAGAVRARGVPVQTGVFQAMMSVQLVNDGPVTIMIDSKPIS
jgi:D-tyrosyl-tRNA(Tyr) deacylase